MIGWYYYLRPYLQWSAVAVYTGWMAVALVDPDVNSLGYFIWWP